MQFYGQLRTNCSLFTIFITTTVLNSRQPSEMGFPTEAELPPPSSFQLLVCGCWLSVFSTYHPPKGCYATASPSLIQLPSINVILWQPNFPCNRVVGNLFTMFAIALLRVDNFKYLHLNGTPRAGHELRNKPLNCYYSY